MRVEDERSTPALSIAQPVEVAKRGPRGTTVWTPALVQGFAGDRVLVFTKSTGALSWRAAQHVRPAL